MDDCHTAYFVETCEHAGRDDDARYALFKEHIPRVIALAITFRRRLPDHILCEAQDFVVIGLKALWDCTERYEGSREATFWTYASSRVWGSILDEMRELDTISRSDRETLTKIEQHRQELGQKLNREVTFEESCVSLGIESDRIRALRLGSSLCFISLDAAPADIHGNESSVTYAETIPDPCSIDPAQEADKETVSMEIETLLAKLPALHRSVVRLYYFSGLRLKDIASVMDVTESRASQMLTEAVERMQKALLRKNGKRFLV